MTDSKILAGKFALVTGGSRGIGAAVVRRLADDGAAVAFSYQSSDGPARELAASIEANGGKALAIKADSADPAQIERAVAHAAQAFGCLDILVNNAGVLSHGVVEGYPLADFDRVLAVNVRAVFVAAQAVLSHMGKGGRIITIGSVAAERAGFAGSSAYCMSKAAVAGLTRGMARDLGPRGITVNVVQPGPIETDMTNSDTIRDIVRPLLAVGRLGTGDEVASLVAYLARPEAAFVTGAALTIDGGYLA
jgi:3-oxoacyl-[acyl-carrier protein] reductase